MFYRLGSTDLNPKGVTVEESQKFAKRLVENGVDVIDVSGGLCSSSPSERAGKQGFFMKEAEKIKEVVDVPVIGVGGITDPEYADKVIREGKADLVAVGRAVLKDPAWFTKALKQLK